MPANVYTREVHPDEIWRRRDTGTLVEVTNIEQKPRGRRVHIQNINTQRISSLSRFGFLERYQYVSTVSEAGL